MLQHPSSVYRLAHFNHWHFRSRQTMTMIVFYDFIWSARGKIGTKENRVRKDCPVPGCGRVGLKRLDRHLKRVHKLKVSYRYQSASLVPQSLYICSYATIASRIASPTAFVVHSCKRKKSTRNYVNACKQRLKLHLLHFSFVQISLEKWQCILHSLFIRYLLRNSERKILVIKTAWDDRK